ncbi:MAG: hypothetical protein ACYS7Y_11895 [Planctomycetota bacterium]|jgi:hypothetical protein
MKPGETSRKASSHTSYWKHKRPAGKRALNKSARQIAKQKIEKGE